MSIYVVNKVVSISLNIKNEGIYMIYTDFKFDSNLKVSK
jgi:hypothetical protein